MAKERTIGMRGAVVGGVRRAAFGPKGRRRKHASAEDMGIRISARRVTLSSARSISQAITEASSRQGLFRTKQVEIKWNGDRMQKVMALEFDKRLLVAAELVKNQVKRNLSKPVLKYVGPKSGTTQVLPESRSVPGEFPRADTTRLMKDIFRDRVKLPFGGLAAIVGTTLDYGLILETIMSRSFLRRTLNEMQGVVTRILTKKML